MCRGLARGGQGAHMDNHRPEDSQGSVEAALAALRAEVSAMREELVDRMRATDARVGDLIHKFSSRMEDNPPAHAEASAAQLAERERTIEALSKHVADLEQSNAELKAEITQLHTQETWTIATNQDLSERLVAALASEKVRVKAQADAESRIQELTRALNEREEAHKSLSKQLDTMRRERNEARQAVKRLSDEVTLLRRANTDLQVEKDTAVGQIAHIERQQRIAFESALAGGKVLKLGEILVSAGLITNKQLGDALGEQSGTGRMVGEILVDKGFVSEEDVAQTVASQMQLPFVHLSDQAIRRDAARTISPKQCRELMCIPIQSTAERLFVAMTNPRNQTAIAQLEQSTNRKVVPLVATSTDIMTTIGRVFGTS